MIDGKAGLNMNLRCVVALTGALAIAPLASAGTKAYVTLCCSTTATVSVLNASTGATILEFPAALGAAIIAPTPDYSAIYELTQLFEGVPGEPWGPTPGAVNSIVVRNMALDHAPTVIPLSAMPFAIAFSPTANLAYVAAVDAQYGAHLIVVDTQAKQ